MQDSERALRRPLAETAPHDVLAWTGPNFAVIFRRSQERTEEWLEALAGATVDAVRDR